MFRYAITFLIFAWIAALVGFSGVLPLAKIFFYIFFCLFLASLLFGGRSKEYL